MANPFKSMGIGGAKPAASPAAAPGGAGMQQMLQSIQSKMLADAEKMNERLEEERIEASSGGGMVTAVVTGHGDLLSIKINPECVDPEDVETLEDLVMGAVRAALEKADTLKTEEQKKLMPAGLPNMPGLSGLFGG